MNKLDRIIDKRGAYLIIDQHGKATLSKIPPKITGEATIGMNLREAFAGFQQRFARGQSEFSAMDLSKISGQHYATVQRWQDSDMIAPHRLNGRERLFDVQTAFACGVLGSLVRAGQDKTVLATVAELLGVAAKKEEPVTA